MYREKAWRQLHKNAASCIEQVLEATPQKQQLYCHLPPITKTIKVRQTGHAGHCWRSKDKLISDVLLWTLSHRWLDNQLEPIYDSSVPIQDVAWRTCWEWWTIEMGRERGFRKIHASSTTWWWWHFLSTKIFDVRSLFSPGAMFHLLPFWIASKENFCKHKVIFAIIQFRTMQCLYSWKNILKKKSFFFKCNSPDLLNTPWCLWRQWFTFFFYIPILTAFVFLKV